MFRYQAFSTQKNGNFDISKFEIYIKVVEVIFINLSRVIFTNQLKAAAQRKSKKTAIGNNEH